MAGLFSVKVDPRLNMCHSVPCNWGCDTVASSVIPPPPGVVTFFDVTLKCIGSLESLSPMGVEWGCMWVHEVCEGPPVVSQ